MGSQQKDSSTLGEMSQGFDKNSLLIKAIHIIELLGSQTESIGIREISRKIKTSPATALRIIRTLVLYGWVQKEDGYGKKYILSGRIGFTTLLGGWPESEIPAVPENGSTIENPSPRRNFPALPEF